MKNGNLGEAMKLWRYKRNKTQKEVAAMMQVSQAVISCVERGAKLSPRLEYQIKMFLESHR